MASGAPRPTKAAIANPPWNALPGSVMGDGSQGKKGDVQYAHALPPSRNAGAMKLLEQRAYFSAWRMVFEVPSGMLAGMRAFPCGLVVGGFAVRSFIPITRAL